MRALRRMLVSTILLAAPASALGAQPTAALGPLIGERVRFELREGPRADGIVQVVDADTIRLRPHWRRDSTALLRALPLAEVRSYRVAMGRDRWRGARRGSAIGGLIGLALVGAALHVDRTNDREYIIPVTVLAVPAAVILSGVGAGVGAIVAAPRWSAPVVLPTNSPAPEGPPPDGPSGR